MRDGQLSRDNLHIPEFQYIALELVSNRYSEFRSGIPPFVNI